MSVRLGNKIIAGNYKSQIISSATTEQKGIIKLATENDITDLNTTKAVTPKLLKDNLDTKQDILTAGSGISIENNTIINTKDTVDWGKINGNITSQKDLQDVLNTKVDTNYLNTQLSLKQDLLEGGNGIEIVNNKINGSVITFRKW